MSAVAELAPLGVRLWAEDGRLRYDAPAGVMTAARLATLCEHKAAILAELAPSERDTSPAAIRARYREKAAALLGELEALALLTADERQEIEFYRYLLFGHKPRRSLWWAQRWAHDWAPKRQTVPGPAELELVPAQPEAVA